MKYVIFDIDGTLTDTTEVDDHCYLKAFKSTFNLDISGYDWESITHVTDWGISEEIFLNEHKRLPTSSELERLQDKFIQLLNEERVKDRSRFKEIEGAVDFLLKLKGRDDCRIGIATGGWERSALLKLKAIGVSGNDIPFSNSNYFKTRESILHHVIQQLIEKHRSEEYTVCYFGDGVWDYHTCLKMGVQFIGIDSNGDGKLSSLGAELVFRNFNESDNIISSLL